MLNENVNLALSLLVLLTGGACIAAQLTRRQRRVYVFKPLTMVFVLALAAQPSASTTDFYRWTILAGLLFSLAGDVLLMLPSDRFAAGLASFLIAHLLYIAAFAADAGLASRPGLLLPFAAGGLLVLALLWPGLGRLKPAVLVYVSAIAVMAWQATARWVEVGEIGALLACLGAVLFVVSDAALAIDRFRRPLRLAPLLVLGTYFSAQWLIALSIGVGETLVDGLTR